MANPQDPSAPPSPYQEWLAKQPAAPSGDMNAPSPPMDTPGLAVPAGAPPPAPNAPPVDGVPVALAAPTPDVGVPGALAPPVPVGPQTGGQGGGGSPALEPSGASYSGAGYGGSPVAEAKARAKRDAAENDRLKGQYDQAVQQQKEATDAVAEVDRYRAADLAENLQHGQRELLQIAAKGKESAEAHDRVLQQRDQALQDAMNTQKNMVFDPDQYVHSMNVGQKIFTAIAVGLSAMGSSRSIGGNGDNIALNMLKESIQHGVDQQKEAYRRAGVNIDMANNAYARARQAGMDDKDATTAARLASINDHKTAADVITARYEPDKIEANRKVLLANLDAEHVKAQQTFAQSSQAAAARAAADVFNTQRGVFDMGMQAENLQLRRDEMNMQHEDRRMAAAAKAKNSGGIAGWSGVAPTQEQQNKAAGVVGAYEAIAPLMKQAMEFRKDHSHGTVFDREAVGKAEAIHEATLLEVKNLAQLGVLSDSDIQLVNKLIGPSADSVGGDSAYNGRMTQAMDYIKKKAYSQMRGFGYSPTADSDPNTRKADPNTATVRFKEAEGGR